MSNTTGCAALLSFSLRSCILRARTGRARRDAVPVEFLVVWISALA